MGRWHADCARRVEGYELRGVCDITPGCRAVAEQKYGLPAFDDLDRLLADEQISLIVVETSSHAHVEPVLAALAAGKHVLVDKPIALSEADAARMFAAAERAKRHLLTFQNRRWDAEFLTARAAVESGRLGAIRDIRLIRWEYTRLLRTFGAPEYAPGWRTKAAYGGGNFFDWGPHLLDQLLLLTPAPIDSVFGDLRGRRWSTEVDDQFLTVLRYTDDAVAVVDYSQASFGNIDVTWAISGQDAAFRYENGRGYYYTRRDELEERSAAPWLAHAWDTPYHNIRELLAGRAEPFIRPRETLRLMRVLDAVRESAQTGTVVKIDDEFAPRRPRAAAH